MDRADQGARRYGHPQLWAGIDRYQVLPPELRDSLDFNGPARVQNQGSAGQSKLIKNCYNVIFGDLDFWTFFINKVLGGRVPFPGCSGPPRTQAPL